MSVICLFSPGLTCRRFVRLVDEQCGIVTRGDRLLCVDHGPGKRHGAEVDSVEGDDLELCGFLGSGVKVPGLNGHQLSEPVLLEVVDDLIKHVKVGLGKSVGGGTLGEGVASEFAVLELIFSRVNVGYVQTLDRDCLRPGARGVAELGLKTDGAGGNLPVAMDGMYAAGITLAVGCEGTQDGHEVLSGDGWPIPNVRELVVPDLEVSLAF